MKYSPDIINIHKHFNKINKKIGKIVNKQLIAVLLMVAAVYFSLSYLFSNTKTKTGDVSKVVQDLNNSVVSSLTEVSSTPTSSSSSSGLLSGLFVTLVIIIILIGGIKYLFNFDIYAEIRNMFSNPELIINVNDKYKQSGGGKRNKNHRRREKHHHHNSKSSSNKNSSSSSSKVKIPLLEEPEVFHISDNTYTYDEANAICKAFDSRLATYEELEDAYNNGAEWCSYGWSDNQLALFPIQKKTYNKLQKKKGHEHDCGRPGINGGYISDKNLEYGVNCYGKKPLITNIERKMMADYKVFPKSDIEKDIEHKTQHYKKTLNQILINPFNKTQWNN